jgi:hypothetical protein
MTLREGIFMPDSFIDKGGICGKIISEIKKY